ncbi:helix-turn-helix transcriptional regulator [Fibrella forsythiae]|uniref:Helix-turn-helix transcriptional regulator n=1 Tax=Fibrella forsythiae TaxID=2817061 RepID=A0ABS3JB88_9BACT|nr:helix-turn-helix transcriptional regulator [Fibrella forsythiae]
MIENEDYPIGNIVKRVREEKGLTQAELADLVGTSRAVIGNLESDRYSPTIKTINKVAKAMGLSLRITFE